MSSSSVCLAPLCFVTDSMRLRQRHLPWRSRPASRHTWGTCWYYERWLDWLLRYTPERHSIKLRERERETLCLWLYNNFEVKFSKRMFNYVEHTLHQLCMSCIYTHFGYKANITWLPGKEWLVWACQLTCISYCTKMLLQLMPQTQGIDLIYSFKKIADEQHEYFQTVNCAELKSNFCACLGAC